MNANKILVTSFIAFLFLLIIVAMITASYFARQKQILTNYAIDPSVEKLYGEYKKDQIIVKFKHPLSGVITLNDIQKEATKEASPVAQFLDMVGVGEDQVPDSLVQLSKDFPVENVQKVFTITNENVKGVTTDTANTSLESPLNSTYEISFSEDVPVLQLVRELSKRSDIEYAEPNYIVKIDSIPNDAEFAYQWGLHNTGNLGGSADADIDAPEAWDKTVGDTETIIVAVLDTGVDTGHEDLTNRIWRNTDEPVFDGRDDDNNGFVDDVHGWNFLDNNYNISDSQGHGTHVSGIVGAERGNAKGVSGVADKVKIMPVKFLNSNGEGTLQDAAEGIIYAVDNGAKVVNCSFGVVAATPPQTLYNAINYAKSKDVTIVAAAGNESMDIGVLGNYTYPAAYDLDNIITVASTTIQDKFSSFSNYNAQYVDLAAPGSSIVSTLPNNRYDLKSGTSMATPFVTGAVAVALTHFPGSSYLQIRQYILSSIDTLSVLSGKVATGGRLNLDKMVLMGGITPTTTTMPTLPITVTPTRAITPTSVPTLSVTTIPTATVTPTPPLSCLLHVYGDANCDGLVNTLDYVCWSQQLITGVKPTNCVSSDFNDDGVVTVFDYAVWFSKYIYINSGNNVFPI